jgi:S1-C subfamily serine protease
VAVVAAGAGAAAALAFNHDSSSGGFPAAPTFGSGSGSGQHSVPNGNSNGPLNVQSLRNKVDPAVVDVDSQLKYNDATAEGTGMIISPDGLVLTNNHVIDQSTSVTATLVDSGRSYTARVVGYDSTDDVAVLQLVGASGLKTVTFGDSDGVQIGNSVLALGNAGGRGGQPSAAKGAIEGLNRTIQASDEGANTTETLHNMLQTNAPIQEGDSGGPLVNPAGQVIGMDTAANAGAGDPGGSSGSGTPAATTGFAIPINTATTIARQIAAGRASSVVHIGLAGFMGVSVGDRAAAHVCAEGSGGPRQAPARSGAEVCELFPGTPAASSGLSVGDVITSVNGHQIGSAAALTTQMAGAHPGDRISVGYIDLNGGKHTTAFPLAEWAK